MDGCVCERRGAEGCTGANERSGKELQDGGERSARTHTRTHTHAHARGGRKGQRDREKRGTSSERVERVKERARERERGPERERGERARQTERESVSPAPTAGSVYSKKKNVFRVATGTGPEGASQERPTAA
jgi:hypothetical protein